MFGEDYITIVLEGDTFDDLKGLFHKMPFSMAGFVVAAMGNADGFSRTGKPIL